MPGNASIPAPATPTPATPDATRTRRGRRWRLRDARIRTRLALILLVPLLATGALTTDRLIDAVDRTVEADLVQALAKVAVEASDLGHELHRERIEAVRLLSGGESAGFTAQTARTDAAIAGYQDARSVLPAVPPVAGTHLAAIDAHLAQLVALRQQVLADPSLSVSAALLRYQAMLIDLGAYQASLPAAVTDAALAEQTRAVAAIAAAAAHAADAEAIARTATVTGTLTTAQQEALRGTQTGQREAFTTFGQSSTTQQQAIVERAITGANVDVAEAAITALLDQTSTRPADSTAAGLAGMADLTRYVGRQLYENLLDTLAATRAAVLRQVVIESLAVALVLAAAVVIAILLARMLATALHRLRAAAVGVANTDLPAAVARLADPQALTDTSPAQLAGQIQVPDRLRSRDEIGDVAHALYGVHRTAVHLAAEQAALRTSLSTMFVNLARRSQTLVDTMISRLDQLQRDEKDADRLQQMMAVDSLATRMRRNDENLLVLADADSSPPRTRDALPIDVLRAAQSEIEQFHRVEFGTVDQDVSVAAAAVNDVVRLLAELLDNATRFSRPDALVMCEARRLGHQLVIQITDHGVGMTRDGLQTVNTMLANPRHLDVATVRKMGIAVVARLAARHHIHVQIHSDRRYGTVTTIALPPSALILPAARHHPQPPATAPALPPGPATGRRPAQVTRHHASRRPDLLHDATMPLPVINGQAWTPDQTWTGLTDSPWQASASEDAPRLPQRAPQAQLPGPTTAPRPGPPDPRRPLEQTRDRLSAYQAGVQRARDHRHNPVADTNR